MSGITGLEYISVFPVLDLIYGDSPRKKIIFELIQVIEKGVLEALAKEREKDAAKKK